MTENELLLEQLVRIGNVSELIQADFILMQAKIDNLEILITILMCLAFYTALMRWVSKK